MLYFQSLNGKERSLRPGEKIRFEQVRGEIRTLRLDDNQIALKFHGHVQGMSTGSPENRSSLMPTCLEWLSARHSLSLVLGHNALSFRSHHGHIALVEEIGMKHDHFAVRLKTLTRLRCWVGLSCFCWLQLPAHRLGKKMTKKKKPKA